MDHRHAQVLSSHKSHDRGCTHRRNFLDKQALVMQDRNCFTGVYMLALSALCRFPVLQVFSCGLVMFMNHL